MYLMSGMEKPINNIFNALGSNDSKRAVFLCHKYLKRFPTSHLLKSLLSFSLSSSGKNDEAQQLLKEILDTPKEHLPLDSQFINSLIMTLKKMDRRMVSCG